MKCQALTINAPIATKVVCFSHLLKSASMANSVDPDQNSLSGSTRFASILNLSVMLGNYLQQKTSADDIFRCIFSWRFKGFPQKQQRYQNVNTVNPDWCFFKGL